MVRHLRHVICGLCLAGTLVATAARAREADAVTAAPDPLLVHTRLGDVRGAAVKGVRDFKGIPYAAPPVGTLRFAQPLPAAAWKGVRDATRYASPCPQVSRYGLTEASYEEDCLYLNVTTPTSGVAGESPRPVMVWIHGGAFVGGSSNLYPLEYLARRGDIVVVSVNYRLGVLGFMPHPSFPALHDGGYALEDQRAAMRWVKQNIGAFGGDPGNVTIAGESAGAASVCMHLAAPRQTAGLFDKAIIQSAACTVPLRTVAESNALGMQLAQLVGCSDAGTALACLRGKPVRELVEAAATVAGANVMAFAPSVGNETLPQPPVQAFAWGEFVRVPILNGGNRDEMRLYVAYDAAAGKTVTNDNYLARLEALYGKAAPAIAAAYPLKDFQSAPAAFGTVLSDFMPGGGLSNCLFLRTARFASRHVPVFEYEFSDRAAPPVAPDPGFEMGAVHSAELPYEFPHISHTSRIDGPDLTPPAQHLSEQMVAYWSGFMRTGTPQAPGQPVWPRYASSRDVMRLEPGQVQPFDAAARHQCALWQTLYPRELGD